MFNRYTISVFVFLNVFIFSKLPAFAADDGGGATKTLTDNLAATNKVVGFQSVDLPILVGRLINVLLGAAGLAFLILTIYAGVLYMIAAGDDGKVKTAKKILINAVIGLIIMVASFAISSYVINAISSTVTSANP